MGNQFVAYLDEHHGLGAWVAEQIATDVFQNPAARVDRAGGTTASDKDGRKVASSELSMGLKTASARSRRTRKSAKAAPATPTSKPANNAAGAGYKTWTSPRTSAEATASAVVSGQAEVGVFPLYEASSGFNTETLNALLDFPQEVLTEFNAESSFVLAVPTDLIHEVDQSGFVDSFDATGTRSFQWNAEKQRKYRNRIGVVYAPADAFRQCAGAIDGLRAKGIDVRMIPDGVDAYREGLARAGEVLDPNREVSTRYGPAGQERVSTIKGANHSKPLIGVILSFDKAFGSGGYTTDGDYQLLEKDLTGAEPVETTFIATSQVPQDGRERMDPVSSDFASLHRFLGKGHHASQDASDGPRLMRGEAGVEPVGGPWDYARILYAIPTVGPRVGDHSLVVKRLAEQNLSYRTVTLENREGRPLIVAIDVPAGHQSKLRPVMRAVHKLAGAKRLGVFPARMPMVDRDLRPRPPMDSRWRVLGLGTAAIAAAATALALFLNN